MAQYAEVLWDGCRAKGAVLAVETGRLLFAPCLRLSQSPMTEYCLQVPIGIGSYRLTASSDPARKRITAVRLEPRLMPPIEKLSGYLNVSAPYLFVGDMAYAAHVLDEDTRKIALEACPKKGSVGSFRMPSGEVACCARLGQFAADVGVRWIEDGFRLQAVIEERLSETDPEPASR